MHLAHFPFAFEHLKSHECSRFSNTLASEFSCNEKFINIVGIFIFQIATTAIHDNGISCYFSIYTNEKIMCLYLVHVIIRISIKETVFGDLVIQIVGKIVIEVVEID